MSREVSSSPSLKDWFDENRYRSLAALLAGLHPSFDRKRFLDLTLEGLDERSLMQRLRRSSEALGLALPLAYRDALAVLRDLAPKIDHGFVTLILPDFVALHGRHDFEASMEALKFFTPFGTAEFAIRDFLKDDLDRTLAVMRTWAEDPDPHVRRLASEGCRPRLPWSFRLTELVVDPRPSLPILAVLQADPSPYVRKSVANHLNDISKDHPDLVLETLRDWDRTRPPTAWIARHALRTLVKQGHAGALTLLGAGEKAEVNIGSFTVDPKRIRLGDKICLRLALVSTATTPQRLHIDYVVHYVKASGATSEKVFKWKEVVLGAGEVLCLEKRQIVRDFTTRRHYPGRHRVEVQVNGERLAEAAFELA